MSGVELPLVPGARMLSSASSSTRRSVHSAGSTASYRSSKSQRKSYHDGDDDGGAGSDQDDEDEDQDQDDEPHESSNGSSGGLWDEVESFLNKPSPNFAALAKESNKANPGVDTLPTLKNGEPRIPIAPSGGGNQRMNRPSRVVRKALLSHGGAGSRTIDPKLLQEAFAYAEKIQRVSLDDDNDDVEGDQEQQHRDADKRIGLLRRDASYSSATGGPRVPQDLPLQKQGSLRSTSSKVDGKDKKKNKTVKSSAYGASAKPQPKKKQPGSERRGSMREHSEWDSTPSSADASGDGASHSRKGSSHASAMDQQIIQSLVSNLQNGTSVEELRRELMASQQSMAMSRQVIQEAAKSFFHTKK